MARYRNRNKPVSWWIAIGILVAVLIYSAGYAQGQSDAYEKKNDGVKWRG